MDLNKELALKLRLCWHEVEDEHSIFCSKCRRPIFDNPNPDFTTPDGIVLLLKEMVKREDWMEFAVWGLDAWIADTVDNRKKVAIYVDDYILDTTGKLRDAAIEWLKGKEEIWTD